MIVSGSDSQVLATRLAATLDEPLAAVEYDRFPDGELHVTVGPVDADRAVIVASTVSSRAHIELLQLQDAVREAGIDVVTTVIPYLGYARQDEAFAPGEPVSIRAIAQAIDTGTDRVVTVNPHESNVRSFFDPPARVVDASARLAEPLPADLVDPIFLAPDAGATDLASTVRDAYGRGTVDAFEKTRHSGEDIALSPSELDAEGRDVVVVDDIIATGSTMSETIETLYDQGCNRVLVTCVHPVLAGNAYLKLIRSGADTLYATDTLERPASTVSVAPVIADAIA